MALLVITTVFIGVVIISNVDWLSQRFKNSLGLFSSDIELIRQATSERPPVWSTAMNMSSKHWFNGVGPRAFQSLYQKYSIMPDDPFINTPAGHPHLFILEVAAETGLVGLIGYIIFSTILIRQIQSTINSQYSDAAPWGLSAIVAAFPLSSTMSFYAFFSSCLIWTFIIIFIALSNPLSLPTQHAIEGNMRSVETTKD